MTAQQELQGKVAIVSGSAKGIGAAVCVELASRYVPVVFCFSALPSEDASLTDAV
jgi:NAD(P)-dependent dehydrogenase (short-subunit alcohol dehydrogenase family)